MIRKVVLKTLQSVNCICDCAVDGQSAIDKVKEKLQNINQSIEQSTEQSSSINPSTNTASEQYDLILMDNIMHPMDGIEATKQIIQLGYNGIIFGATGNVMPDDIIQFIEAGAKTVLPKPLSLDELEIAIRKYL